MCRSSILSKSPVQGLFAIVSCRGFDTSVGASVCARPTGAGTRATNKGNRAVKRMATSSFARRVGVRRAGLYRRKSLQALFEIPDDLHYRPCGPAVRGRDRPVFLLRIVDEMKDASARRAW